MLRDQLKKEIDRLNEEQLQQIADYIAFIELKSQQKTLSVPLWQSLTPIERAREFQEWVSQLPKNSPSLSDEAVSRDSIYE